ncbi:hypothetical protein FRC12_012506 [Ceratobasidium sp. 428]|nr:hypothetical protein FRC12_012506 [Ceratobasidium sp. 428]
MPPRFLSRPICCWLTRSSEHAVCSNLVTLWNPIVRSAYMRMYAIPYRFLSSRIALLGLYLLAAVGYTDSSTAIWLHTSNLGEDADRFRIYSFIFIPPDLSYRAEPILALINLFTYRLGAADSCRLRRGLFLF